MELKKQYGYFSAAIRDGAKLRPQGRGCPDDVLKDPERGGKSCALEAGLEALGVEFDWADEYALYEIFPYLQSEVPCPRSGRRTSLFQLCWELNDHGWTREAIADWLYEEEERLGFITVLDTQDTCNTKDNNVTQDSPASLPEEVFA